METIPVTCNHCGAALQVPDSARFVTCRYCNSQLEIKRTESSITTEVLAHLDQRTAAMADDLSVIRRDSEVERLDREWDLRRQNLLTKRRDGSSSAPAAAVGWIMLISGGVFGFIGFIIFSVFAAAFAGAIHASGAPTFFSALPCLLPLFALAIIAVNTVFGVFIIRAAGRYKQEEQQYLQRRQELLAASVTVPPPVAAP